MPLTEQEQKHVEDTVQKVIQKDYFEDFLDVYGTTISIAESHPEQVNNEIRNALTHLARSYYCESLHDATSEIKQARDHIERAKRDSLKLSIITKRDQIQSEIFRIEMSEGAIPQALKLKLREIEKTRKKAFKNESLGKPVINSLETILIDALELEG